MHHGRQQKMSSSTTQYAQVHHSKFLRIFRKSRMRETYMKVLRIFGLIILQRKISCLMRTNIKPTNYRRPLFYIRTAFLLLFAMEYMQTKAQYDPSFAHYWAMEPSFNPAAAGKEAKLNINVAYAMNLAGFENNPRTMYLSADMPFFFLNNYHGVGVAVINDKIGLFSHQKFALQYAYKQRLFGGMLGIGAQLGMLSENFDGSKLNLEESSDPAFSTSSVTGSGLDISAGLYYTHKLWYLGLSAQHLNAPLINLGEKNELKIDRTYYFTGGYNRKLRTPFVTIHPSML